jgi:hypothetical protein
MAENIALEFIEGLGKAANTFVSASFAMTKAASGGTTGLGEMATSVGQATSLIGPAGRIFAETLAVATAVLEKNILTQQTLSDVGATFGGNLSKMRDTVTGTYLNLDQFGKVVGSNADVLASFKGGVQGGTEAFASTLKILQTRGSESGTMLANLGVGFEEAAQLTAQFMRGQGSMNRTGQMSADQLAKATADYAAELTGLSDLTGQSRKALSDKVNEELAEAQFQNFLNTLSSEEAAKLKEAVAQEYAVTGKAGADALKASAAGFPPMTKASQMFTATQEASVERQRELMNKIRDSSVDLDTFRAQSKTILAASLDGMREDQKRISNVAMAGVLQGGTDLTNAIVTITKFLNATFGKTPEEVEKIRRETVEQAKIAGTGATTGIDMQKQIIDMATNNLKLAEPILNASLTKGMSIAQSINDNVTQPLIKGVGSIIEKLDTKPIGTALDGLGKRIKEQVENFDWNGIVKAFNDTMKGAVSTLSNPKETGDPNSPKAGRLAGALGGGVWDTLDSLGTQLVSIGNAAIALVNGDLGKAAVAFNTVIPEFFKMTAGWIDRIEQIRGIFGERTSQSSAIATPSSGPVPYNQNSGVLTPRAEGGATTPGSYLVGEQGPEVLNLGTRGDVISNDNLTAMISALSNQNDMGESIDQLNNTNSQMLAAIRDLIDVSKRTLTATKGLNGNL